MKIYQVVISWHGNGSWKKQEMGNRLATVKRSERMTLCFVILYYIYKLGFAPDN